MAADRPVKIVALGDSLTAGYGLDRQSAFPEQLGKVLKGKGIAVEIENAGVSGDTASGGLSRLDWSVGDGTDAVILELGANDMLRGVDPKVTRKALETIIERLKARNIEVLLAGMRAAPNMGEDYLRGFDAIYPELAAEIWARLLPVLPRRRRDPGKIRAAGRIASECRRCVTNRYRNHAKSRGIDSTRSCKTELLSPCGQAPNLFCYGNVCVSVVNFASSRRTNRYPTSPNGASNDGGLDAPAVYRSRDS